MKPLHYFFIAAALMMAGSLNAQVAINTTGAGPDGSAILDLSNTANKGLLIPSVTIATRPSSPATGLLIYQTDGTPGFYYNAGTSGSPSWTAISSGAATWGSITGTLSSQTDLSTALSGKEPSITAGTTSQYFRGDKTFTQVDLTTGVTNYLLIANGGTGQTTANAALNALLPTQVGNNLSFLTTNGTNASWSTSGLDIGYGGTGATDATTALTNLITASGDQTGNYLSTDGTQLLWTPAGGGSGNLPTIDGTTSGGFLTNNGTSASWSSIIQSQWSGTPLSYSGSVSISGALSISGTSGTLTVNKGITSSSGNLSLAGNISTSNGNISTSNGYISSTGNISTSNGNISASNGSLSITSQNNSVILVADTGFNVSGNKTSYLANFTNTNSSGSGIYIKTGGIGSQVSPWAIFVENGANSKKYGLALNSGGTAYLWYSPSDIKLKNNITNTRFNIDTLMKIKVRDFYFKDDSNKFKVTGFIAQELFQAYPNAVRKPNNSSDIWMVSKEELIPLIVKSIQDQQNEIDTLKSHLQNQQQTIQDLLKRVAVLEAKK